MSPGPIAVGNESDLDSVYVALGQYCASYEASKSHGFLIEVALPSAGDGIVRIAKAFKWLILGLIEKDGRNVAEELSLIESEAWQFTVHDTRVFMNVFSSEYSKDHTKYVPGDNMFVFGQPERSFDFCGVSPRRRDIRDGVRRRFLDAGRPYPFDLIDRRIESLIYLFPPSNGDAPVRWWTS